jgi:hypothetical protein
MWKGVALISLSRKARMSSTHSRFTYLPVYISIMRPTRPPMKVKASATTAARSLRYWRCSSFVSLVGLVGIHWHVMRLPRKRRLASVIVTVCSPTRKLRTKTAVLSFMAVSIFQMPSKEPNSVGTRISGNDARLGAGARFALCGRPDGRPL